MYGSGPGSLGVRAHQASHCIFCCQVGDRDWIYMYEMPHPTDAATLEKEKKMEEERQKQQKYKLTYSSSGSPENQEDMLQFNIRFLVSGLLPPLNQEEGE